MLLETTVLDEKLLLDALLGFENSDLTTRLPAEWTGVPGKIADTFNGLVELNERILKNIELLGNVVGKRGKVTQRLDTGNVSGSWNTMLELINTLVDDLVQPTNEVARVISAVANGDLSQTMALDVDGRPNREKCIRVGASDYISKPVNVVQMLSLLRIWLPR